MRGSIIMNNPDAKEFKLSLNKIARKISFNRLGFGKRFVESYMFNRQVIPFNPQGYLIPGDGNYGLYTIIFLFLSWSVLFTVLGVDRSELLYQSLILTLFQLLFGLIQLLILMIEHRLHPIKSDNVYIIAEISSKNDIRSLIFACISTFIGLYLIIDDNAPINEYKNISYGINHSKAIIITFVIMVLITESISLYILYKRRDNSDSFLNATSGKTLLILGMAIIPFFFGFLGVVEYAEFFVLGTVSLAIFCVSFQVFIFIPTIIFIESIVPLSISSFRTLFKLIRSRFNLLGLSFLIAIVLFLNADSWQLVSGISWVNMLILFLLIYIAPMLFLLLPKAGDLSRHWQRKWNEINAIRFDDLKNVCFQTKIHFSSSIWKIAENGFERRKKVVEVENAIIHTSVLFEIALLLILMPIVVAIFSWTVFYFAMSNQILETWLNGFSLTSSFQNLRIKAAFLLGLLSSVSTLGDLINSKKIIEFVDANFFSELDEERKFLALYTSLIMGTQKDN